MGTSPDFDAYEKRRAAQAALADEVLPLNRAGLFDLLAAAGIHTVIVSFDGSGDSGAIEGIDAMDADNDAIHLPTSKIEYREAAFDCPSLLVEQRTAREIVEIMAYDFLEQTHDGWENDDGAFGELTFVVPERTITLDHNERFVSTSHYWHEF